MSELSTLARPYAEAVFKLALESGKLDHWSEMLEFLSLAMQDKELAWAAVNPNVSKEDLLRLILDVGKGYLDKEGQNFVKLLVENDKITLIDQIRELYEQFRAEHEGLLDVEVRTAYALSKENEKKLSAALEKKFGKKVRFHVIKDNSLIGGVQIKAGDKVIDGSVRGQLERLAKRLFS
ncbi:MAG: ATP synthase subunit delta [Methylothermaceae bacteria B42]|nr:MAG: ATP synthase subunit delta [Methylothermaceae bacteria B42]HHJ39070.1 F0F1 ATP synthase subunit delta [Methylothermaceae bacterium]